MAVAVSRLLVNVNANTRQAEKQLDQMGRRINDMGRGFRFASGLVRGFTRAAAVGFASMGVQAATAHVMAFTASLAPLVNLVGLLPAGALAAGAAFAALTVGTLGVADALKAVNEDSAKFTETLTGLSQNAREFAWAVRNSREAFSQLRLPVQDALFRGLGATVEALARGPMQTVTGGLVALAGRFNDAIHEAGRWALLPSTMDGLLTVIHYTDQALRNLKGAVQPALDAFLGLGTVGASFLPALAAQVTSLANRFAAFVAEGIRTGSIADGIQRGIDTAKVLGSILGNVGGIIRTVFSAGPDGAGLLATVDQLTERFNTFLNSMGGQSILQDFFANAARHAQVLAPVIGAVVSAFVTGLMPVLTSLATGLAPGLVQFLQALAPALAGLAPTAGELGAAVGRLLVALIPMIPVLADMATWLVDTIIPVMDRWGPQIVGIVAAFALFAGTAAMIQSVAATFSVLSTTISLVTRTMVGARAGALALSAGLRGVGVGTGLSGFAGRMNQLGVLLRAGVVNARAWATAQMAAMRATVTAWATSARAAITGALAQVRAWAMSAASAVAGAARMAAAMAATVARTVAGWVLMGTQSLIQAARMAAAWVIAMGPIGWIIAAVVALVALIIANWDTIKAFTVQVWGAITSWISDQWDAIVAKVQFAVAFVQGVIQAVVGAILTWWITTWGNVQATVTGVWAAITTYVGWAINKVKDTVQRILLAVTMFWRQKWNEAKALVLTVWALIQAAVQAAINRVKAIVAQVVAIVATVRNAFEQARAAAGERINAMIALVKSLPGKALSALSNLGSTLYSKGRDLIQGLINGITNMIGKVRSAVSNVASAIKDFLPGSPIKMGPLVSWNNGGAGKRLAEFLASGIEDSTRRVRAAAAEMASAASAPLTQALTPGSPGAPATGAARGQERALASAMARAGQGGTTVQHNTWHTWYPRPESEAQATNRSLQRTAALRLA